MKTFREGLPPSRTPAPTPLTRSFGLALFYPQPRTTRIDAQATSDRMLARPNQDESRLYCGRGRKHRSCLLAEPLLSQDESVHLRVRDANQRVRGESGHAYRTVAVWMCSTTVARLLETRRFISSTNAIVSLWLNTMRPHVHRVLSAAEKQPWFALNLCNPPVYRAVGIISRMLADHRHVPGIGGVIGAAPMKNKTIGFPSDTNQRHSIDTNQSRAEQEPTQKRRLNARLYRAQHRCSCSMESAPSRQRIVEWPPALPRTRWRRARRQDRFSYHDTLAGWSIHNETFKGHRSTTRCIR